MVYCSYRQYYRKKANTIKLYGKMFSSEIHIQHTNWNFTKCIIFSEFKKTPPFTENTAVILFIKSRLIC